MFESLTERLEGAVKNLKGQGRISEINVAQTVKEIRKALVNSDVNYKVAKEVTDRVKEEAQGEKVLKSVSPGQQLTKIVSDELTNLMGGAHEDINLNENPSVILMAGLQGSGKTTFSSKLANFINEQGKSTMLVACDVHRPAAIDQLKVLGEQTGIEVYSEPDNNKAVKIAQNAIDYAKKMKYKAVIIDTAGRQAVDEEMMNEISSVKKAVNPTETLFVVDAMTGQDAVNTAKAFYNKLDYNGVVLTKMDGDTRGGAALSIKAVVDRPIKFIGTGEKVDAIERFYPDRMAQRILGMGDVVSFVERAQQVYDEEESRKLNKKIRKNQFDYNDFLSQIDQINKMGNLKDVASMIPGMNKMLKDTDEELDENTFKPVKAIIHSMTPYERANPDVINGNRKKRIAKGSGNSVQEINKLVKQFEDMRKMMKMMNKKGGAKNLMSKMGQMFE